MLPFLDEKKKVGSAPVEAIQASTREDVGLQVAAQELIEAVRAGDVDAVALCLRMAFKMLEAEPHDEGSL